MGVFRAGLWVLDYDGSGNWEGAPRDRAVTLGQAGDIPVVGNWNGLNGDDIGFWRPSDGMWLADYNGNGYWDPPNPTPIDRLGYLGADGDTPVVGDWHGDGRSKVGIFRAG